MKDQQIIDQLIRQRVKELAETTNFTYYEELDPEWEGLIQGGDDENRLLPQV